MYEKNQFKRPPKMEKTLADKNVKMVNINISFFLRKHELKKMGDIQNRNFRDGK